MLESIPQLTTQWIVTTLEEVFSDEEERGVKRGKEILGGMSAAQLLKRMGRGRHLRGGAGFRCLDRAY